MKIDHLIRLGRLDPILEEDAYGVEMLTGWMRKPNARSNKHDGPWKLKHPQAWIVRGRQTPGVTIVMAERKRVIQVEGFNAARDDGYTNGELARAAQCYERDPAQRKMRPVTQDERHMYRPGQESVPESWPWTANWWKPGDRVRELAKAGALYLAEAERLKRAGETEKADLVTRQALGCCAGIDNIYKVTPMSPGPHLMGLN